MDFSHLIIGAALFTIILKVEGQAGTLTISADRPCVGGSLTLTCVQNGTFPTGAGFFVVFYKNQDETSPVCSVDARTSCSPTFPSGNDCGCISSNGDVRVHKYTVSSVSKNEETLWRCTRAAFPTSDTVRSGDITPDIAEGATISSGSLTLRNAGSSLECSGPTSMGDATLVITRNDTGEVLGNASSTTLTVPLPNITGTDLVTFTCSLGGRGARCSSVTPGVLTVSAPSETTFTTTETVTSSGVDISTGTPCCARCRLSLITESEYFQHGTKVSITVIVCISATVTWSRPGVSTRVPDGVDTAMETLTFTANKSDGIEQTIQAQAGNSKQNCTLVVDDYHPDTPAGLAAGLGSSCGCTLIIIVFYIVTGKEKEEEKDEESEKQAANARKNEGQEGKGDGEELREPVANAEGPGIEMTNQSNAQHARTAQTSQHKKGKREESRLPAPNAEGSGLRNCIMICAIVFVVVTFGLLVALSVVFSKHSESLTKAFGAALIAGWICFGLGVLCVLGAAALGFHCLLTRNSYRKKRSFDSGKSVKPESIFDSGKSVKPESMRSPGRRLSPLLQEKTETNATNGQPQPKKKKKNKKNKKEKVDENKIRPLPIPNSSASAQEEEEQ